ncbi:MAG: hypothetical protein ACYC4R_05255 [Anaerolineae bacterium]
MEGQDQQAAVRIDWHVPEGLPTLAATNMVISHTAEGEFFVTFFEVRPPIILDGQEDALRNTTSVTATAVARVMLASSRMPGIIEALQGNYQNWKTKFAQRDDDER